MRGRGQGGTREGPGEVGEAGEAREASSVKLLMNGQVWKTHGRGG